MDANGDRPPAPREAVLIRIARQARRIRAPAAARAAGITKGRWSQIENGYELRDGKYKPVTALPETLAHMAFAVGAEPDQLREAGREDAADILAEIIRQRAEAPEPEPVPEDPVIAHLRKTPGASEDEIRTYIKVYEAYADFPPRAARRA